MKRKEHHLSIVLSVGRIIQIKLIKTCIVRIAESFIMILKICIGAIRRLAMKKSILIILFCLTVFLICVTNADASMGFPIGPWEIDLGDDLVFYITPEEFIEHGYKETGLSLLSMPSPPTSLISFFTSLRKYIPFDTIIITAFP